MFRRLYWYVEQVIPEGPSCVTGIYTSIQDLVHVGLKWSESAPGRVLRLTLVKPDTFDAHFGQWNADQIAKIAEDMAPFLDSKEYTEEEVKTLIRALEAFMVPAG